MKAEQIIKRPDGSRIKIRVSIWGSLHDADADAYAAERKRILKQCADICRETLTVPV